MHKNYDIINERVSNTRVNMIKDKIALQNFFHLLSKGHFYKIKRNYF